MKTFRVQIRAYGYYADFELASEDSSEAFENALVDKLGKNAIKWEKDGFISKSKLWLTYEEVINGGDNATSRKPVFSQESIGSRMGAGASERG